MPGFYQCICLKSFRSALERDAHIAECPLIAVNIELRAAEAVIRRGIKAAERQEWEVGQTQGEWIAEARQYLSMLEPGRDIEKERQHEG